MNMKTYYENGYVVEYLNKFNDTPCRSWLLLPAENLWPQWLRGALYILAMAYLFIGIAIASDVFMCSIEVITSKKRKIVRWDEERKETVEREVLLWNETVANLTLMALGSSAPEILLAVIETSTKLNTDMSKSDGLGTFTIIGSAAFNLLVITAICIVSVPSPDVKFIREFGVFVLTAICSLWAYVWMLLVVQFISPGIIEPWEAWVTLAYFPTFVILAYCQDSGWWCKRRRRVDDEIIDEDEHVAIRVLTGGVSRAGGMSHVPGKELVALEADRSRRLSLCSDKSDCESDMCAESLLNTVAIRYHNHHHIFSPKDPDLYVISEADTASTISARVRRVSILHEHRTFARARFRHAAVRAMMGHHIRPRAPSAPPRMLEIVTSLQKLRELEKTGRISNDETLFGKFTFASPSYAVLESAGNIDIDILYHRRVPPIFPCTGTSSSKEDPSGLQTNGGTGLTPPDIHDNSTVVTPSNVLMQSDLVQGSPFQNGPNNNTSTPNSMSVVVEYETREGAAKIGKDFKYSTGKLMFKDTEYRKTISIPILNGGDYKSELDFYLILKNPQCGAGIGDPSVARIVVIDDDEPGELLFEQSHYTADLSAGKLAAIVKRQKGCDGKVFVHYSTIDGTARGGRECSDDVDFKHQSGTLTFNHGESSKQITIEINKDNCHGLKNFIIALKNPSVGAKIGEISAAVCCMTADDIGERIADLFEEDDEEITWAGQFRGAMQVGGGDGKASASDYVLHFLTFFWKIFMAFIPPPQYLGAWPAFVLSLFAIGILTACVEQLGDLLGCVVGLENSVTGITIIALGTSLPDTFASRTAAKQDEHADAAIGNITGSNSVNVFLGLGLPWVIGTSYALSTGIPYKVATGNLTQSVIIFSIFGGICLLLLVGRRRAVGGELGGGKLGRLGCSLFLVLLWGFYILLSTLRAYGVFVWI